MRLSELYRSKENIDISIELFPPKTSEGVSKLLEKVSNLQKLSPSFFSMTYGAGGSTRQMTLELVDTLKNKIKVETMCHLTVLGQSKEETRSILNRLQKMGVYNLIALRGDPPVGDQNVNMAKDGFRHAADLVAEAASRNYFSIAVAGFPESHPESPDRKTDLQYLKKKVDAGAVVIITQLFYDNDFFYSYVEDVRKMGVKVPVIPGILPILSVKQIRRFTELCKSKIPKNVAGELSKYESDDLGARMYGIELATRQCEGLLKFGVPGIHFYALNQAQSVEVVLQNLRLVKN